MQLTVSGKGNAHQSWRQRRPFVLIEEIPHELFERDGNNLYLEHYITFPQAVLGTNVDIPTIDGKARIKIAAGTQS